MILRPIDRAAHAEWRHIDITGLSDPEIADALANQLVRDTCKKNLRFACKFFDR